MKPIHLTILCAVLFILPLGGCEELALFGGGVAADETLQAWRANLDAKKAELQQQYDQVLRELETAPDPNAVKVARDKLAAIADQQLINEGARLAVQAALEAPGSQAPAGERRDFWAAIIAGGAALAYQTITKRRVVAENDRMSDRSHELYEEKEVLNSKYISMKAGQARLRESDPDAEAKLYSYIGQARTARGL